MTTSSSATKRPARPRTCHQQIAMPDFDTAPQDVPGYHTLSGQAATFRFAERFVDGQLVGAGDATAVADQSWACFSEYRFFIFTRGTPFAHTFILEAVCAPRASGF